MTDIDITKRPGPNKHKPKPQWEEGPSFDTKIEPSTEGEDTGIETAVNVEEREKNEGVKILIMVGVLVGIFALVFGGFYWYNSVTGAQVINVDELHQQNLAGKLEEEEGYMYNGYSFVKVEELWWTEVNKFGTLFKLPLHAGPKELENITVKGKLNPQFNQGGDIYVAIDPTVQDKYYTLAVSELSFNVVQSFDRKPIGSCTKEDPICQNRTIVNCKNNPTRKPVIELAWEEKAGIELQDMCIKLSGKGPDLTLAVDRLIYRWLWVMN